MHVGGFVSRTQNGRWQCHQEKCKEASEGRKRSRSDTADLECSHISAAISACDKSHRIETCKKHIHLSSSALQAVPFPLSVLTAFENHVTNDKLDKIIHRVSDQCFVVQTTSTSEAPLGVLHVRVDKRKQFHCSCKRFKQMTSLCGATTAPKVSKRCLHIYICLWAVFSDELLKDEFSLCLFSELST